MSATASPSTETSEILKVENVSVYYGDFRAVKDVSMVIPDRKVTALIGPSGCGKSTYLRCFNRMNDSLTSFRIAGKIWYHGQDLYGETVDPAEVRKRIGMVFQKPNPFAKSIFDNVAWGPRINGFLKKEGKSALEDYVRQCLIDANLWDEVKDRLQTSALALSGGQRQRLCIARAIANDPEIFLMDEPCSALDPISSGRIEDLLIELKKSYTIIIVTHNMEQAARVSDKTAFFLHGELVEFSPTAQLFSNPREEKTEQYITGRFG